MHSSLHVHRLQNEYYVARSHPASDAVRASLDRAAERVAGALAERLSSWVESRGEQSDEVLLIRELTVECEVDVDMDVGLLAERWAAHLARALLARVESQEGLARFESVAAYRASFLIALASGAAFSAWFYRPFAGLFALRSGAVVVSVLSEQRDLGLHTLAVVGRLGWSTVSALLTADDAVRVLEALSEPTIPVTSNSPSSVPAVFEFFDSAVALPHTTPADVRALFAFSCATSSGQAPTRGLVAWARSLGSLAAAVVALGPSRVARAVANGRFGELIVRGANADLRALDAIMNADAATCVALAELLASRSEGASLDADDECPAPNAGLALLIADLDALFSESVCATLPELPNGSARDAAGWLTLALTAGAAGFTAAVQGVVWRRFFGVAAGFDGSALAAWLGPRDVEPALEALSVSASRFVRGELLTVPVRMDGCGGWLVVDDATGIWARASAHAEERARSVLSLVERETVPLISRLRHARTALADARFLFGSGAHFGAWAPFFVQAAQIVLRRLAYRLPGFARSSLGFVHHNLLAVGGVARAEPACLRLRVSKPPLHVALSMAGTARAPLAWGERRVVVEYV